MYKLLIVLLILLFILVTTYVYKVLKLKKITKDDLPSEGDWAPLSRGNIYYRWYSHDSASEQSRIAIFVHGFSTPSFVWEGLIKQFNDRGYKVLVYDHFGRGYSERPRTKYDKSLYLETLRELIIHQNINTTVDLIGYSMGGPIVSYYANLYPENVRSLNLIAPAGFGMAVTDEIKSWRTMPIVGDWLWRVFSDKIYGIGNMSETKFSDDPLAINEDIFLPKFREQLKYRGFNEALLSTVRNFNLFDVRAMYKELTKKDIPVLAVWGKKDGIVPYHGSKEFKSIFSEGKLVTIEEGTHDITYRQPSQVGEGILNFICKI
tara:strand:+ start:3432 stop:4388 length:957 start_codon:yes stop_codon:yes gene_type:complete